MIQVVGMEGFFGIIFMSVVSTNMCIFYNCNSVIVFKLQDICLVLFESPGQILEKLND